MMNNSKIAFVGAGNMAHSIIAGLLNANINKENIYASSPDTENLKTIKEQLDIHVDTDNKAVVKDARIVVLCVKPNKINFVLEELKEILLEQKPLIISVAAGVSIEVIELILGKHLSIVRAMPNTPAMLSAGATGLYANGLVSENEQNISESIFRSVGIVVWAQHEKELDIITALSGSGPAYFFYLMEAMENAASEAGLPHETARLLAIQTAFGASKLALENHEEPAVLRQRVTSPKGTTEAAIKTLQANNLEATIKSALDAGIKRAEEITQSTLDELKS